MSSPQLTLAGIFVLIGAGLAMGLVWLVALILLRPRRMTDARALVRLRRLSPADLGMEFEEQSFGVLDEFSGRKIGIAGWWIPCPTGSNRCVILLHGYADAKVGAIAWGPMFQALGFHILAIDLRAHGQSEGKYSTAGYFEREDVSQVIDQIRARKPEKTAEIVLFGASLGAGVAAATGAMREDLMGVILESPFADYEHAVMHQADRVGMPGKGFQRAALWMMQRIARCDFSAVRPVDTIGKITSPVMVIATSDDPFVPAEDLAALRAAVEGRRGLGVFWEIAEAHHLLGILRDPEEYRRRISEFLMESGRVVRPESRL
ncbi:MAG: alpha/beta fold hydrolase [Tepidisphaeraceae bacterium]|jgi:alpha-beta hydrolase superfamily lysophospholipase